MARTAGIGRSDAASAGGGLVGPGSGVSPEYPWEKPLGARPLGDDRVEFRVWAPHAQSVGVRVSSHEIALGDAGFGVYEVVAPAHPGDDYLFVLDGHALPD